MSNSFKIVDVQYNSKKPRPIILDFQNGIVQPGQEKNLACGVYENQDGKLTVAVASEKLVYTGEVNRNDELCYNFIAIRNKLTNKMRLIAIDTVTLAPNLLKDKDEPETSVIESRSISTKALNKEFGSRRVKRQTDQIEKMQMDIEHVKEQLQQTVADIHVDVKDMVAPTIVENDDEYRPPINRNANRLQDVYLLEQLVPSFVLDSLSGEVSRILDAREGDMGTTSFITKKIKEILSTSDVDSKCQLLLYIDCLIKFLVTPARTVGTKRYNACSYSHNVNSEILKMFTVISDTGRSRPITMRDKCLCYVLVLSMIASNYILNLEGLALEVKIGVKKLQEISRILAFSASPREKFAVVLSLPLPAPITVQKRGRGRKSN